MTSGDPASDAALRRHLATTLPEYMRPARFVRMTSLPRSPNGKIDRTALPDPPARRGAQENAAFG